MTDPAPSRPLVTFALFAYNQEQFIREAVEGAFSQTYTPLEIILSDDCSLDRTFEIMQEMAAAYEGPHRVLLRRNAENCRLAGHINTVADEASGDIIVIAAGDDISHPKRTAIIAAEFQKPGPVYAVLTGYSTIPEGAAARNYGRLNPRITSAEIICAGGGVQIGATYAYKARCLHWPQKIPHWLQSEDRLLPFRAALLGTVRYIDRPLVYYRVSASDEIDPTKNRVHGYNHPLHLELLKENVMAARSARSIGYARAIYMLILLNLLERYLKKREMGVIGNIESKLIFNTLRLVRKISSFAERQDTKIDR